MRLRLTLLAGLLALVVGCSGNSEQPPTAADAAEFINDVDAQLRQLGISLNQAGWVQQNLITVDTEAINVKASTFALTANTRSSSPLISRLALTPPLVPVFDRLSSRTSRSALGYGSGFYNTPWSTVKVVTDVPMPT